MPAPTFVAAGTQVTGVGTVSASWPSHITGDIGILVIEQSGTDTTLTPSGWTHVTGSPRVDVASTAGSKFSILWKRAASGAEAAVATGDGGDHQTARIFTYRGAISSGSPIHISAASSTATASTSFSCPSITTTIDDCAILLAVSRPNDNASTTTFGSFTNAGLEPITERGEGGSTQGNGGGFKFSDGIKTTAGATGTSTGTSTVSTTNTSFTIALAPAVPVINQTAFGFYEDGTESGSTLIGATNTNQTRTVNTDSNILLRTRLQETGAVAGGSTDDYQLQYSLNSGTYTNIGSGAVLAYASPSLTDGGATTNRLGAGIGSFVAGEISETGLVTDHTLTASNYTEHLYALTLKSTSVNAGDTLDFRILRNGAVINSYTVTPRINVTKLSETLIDDFSSASIDTTKWTNISGANTAQASSQLTISSVSGSAVYSGYRSVYDFDMTNSYAYASLVSIGNQALVSWQAVPIQIFFNATNTYSYIVSGNTLIAQKQVGGVFSAVRNDTTYNIVTHKYLRIREASGTTYFDYSADGTTWINYTSLANAFALTSVKIEIVSGTYAAEGSATSAVIGDFNTASVSSGTDYDITKSAQYAVASDATQTKSATYTVATVGNITRSAQYAVTINTDITKTADYDVLRSSDLTRSAQYTVPSDATLTRTADYDVSVSTDITRSASYSVNAVVDIQKTSDYDVASSVTLTRTAQYTTTVNTDITKTADYDVARSSDITKSATYSVTSSTDITRTSTYTVALTNDVTKSADYDVAFDADVTLNAQYVVQVITTAYATLTVDGDGTTTSGWTAEGGTYTRVQSDDGDTSRLYSPINNDVRQFTLSDTSGLTGASITSVTVYAKYRSLDPVSNTFQIGIRTNGVDYYSANKDTNPSTSYILFSEVWTLNPNTGLAWTISELDALQIGVKKTNGAGGAVTYMYAVVEYETSGDTDYNVTLNAQYEVASDITITRNAAYAVQVASDITKQATYSVSAFADITKLADYDVARSSDITRNATYTVPSSTTITRTADYDVAVASDITKAASYTVPSTNSVALTSDYDVLRTSDLTRSATYAVPTTSTLNLSSDYDVSASTDVTKTAIYNVAKSYDLTRTADYDVSVSSDITKQADYDVLSNADITKASEYVVTGSGTIALQARYTVPSTQTTTLSASYAVPQANDITKTGAYSVAVFKDVTISASYVVLDTNDVTKQSVYTVNTTQTVTKSASYAVLLSSDISKIANYTVARSETINILGVYTVIVSNTIELSASYSVSLGNFDYDITKQAQYVVTTQTDITKPANYIVVAKSQGRALAIGQQPRVVTLSNHAHDIKVSQQNSAVVLGSSSEARVLNLSQKSNSIIITN